MNKKIFILPLFAFSLLIPSITHAAFTLTTVSQNGDGRGYSTTNTPVYTEQTFNITGYSANPASTPLQACNTALQRSGLSDTLDTYCVYDGKEMYIPTVSGCFDSSGVGGCNVPPYGPSPTAPPNSPSGSWPVSASDMAAGYYPNITISVYQSPLQQQSLTTMQTALGFAMNNMLCDFGSCPNGRMPDPGYRDVCPNAHDDNPGVFNLFTGPAFACSIYHHDGVVNTKPVASLTASPSTIVSGSTSLLTYSCSNGATTATIDNGVGAQSPASSGSAPVSPITGTTYTLTCTNAAGSSTATASVAVTPVLTASCAASPSSIAVNASASWAATPSGGNGTYAYSWSGTDSLSGTTASVSKPYATAGTKTGSVTVTSGTQSVTQACSNTVIVAAALPPAPASITASCNASGNQVSLSWPAASGATTYYPRFSVANAGQCPSGWQIYTDGTTCYPNPDGTSGTSVTNFPINSGQQYGAWVHSGNASGVNWGQSANTTFTCAAPSAVTCNLSANPSTAPSTLTWSSTNATSCTGSGFSTGGANLGSVSVNTNGTYILSCSSAGGSCSTSAVVGAAACTNPSGTISATPNRIRTGQSTSISYTASGITTSCTVTGPGVNQTIPANSCAVPGGSMPTGTLSTQSTYILTCDGIERARTTVNVVPKFIEF